jgi:hypothetical protein
MLHSRHISVKTPPPLAGTGHNGLGSVDALREEIEGRHPRVSWVSHVHGPYPYLVIRGGRSNRSSLEGCGRPPRYQSSSHANPRTCGSGRFGDSGVARQFSHFPPMSNNTGSRTARVRVAYPRQPRGVEAALVKASYAAFGLLREPAHPYDKLRPAADGTALLGGLGSSSSCGPCVTRTTVLI